MEGGPHQMAKYQANIENKCAPIDPTNKQLQAQWTGLGFQKGAMKALGMGKGLQLCGLMSGTSLNIESFCNFGTSLHIVIQSSLKTLRDKTRDNLSELGV